jgi:archaeal type IV pilus assembly protein PilA
VGITVALATMVAIGASSLTAEPTVTTAAFEFAADGETGTITIEHVAGDAVDVGALAITVTVDGESLSNQPPVPFVGSDGFSGSPSGPFNAETDQNWTSGERASFTVAETNDPTVESGDTVTVRLAIDGQRVATLEETAS